MAKTKSIRRSDEATASGETGEGGFKKFATKLALIGGVIATLAAIATNLTTIQRFFAGEMDAGEVALITSLATEPYVYPADEGLDASMQYQVSYTGTEADAGLTIRHEIDSLTGEAKNVGILGAGPFFALPKVGIDIKLVNNSKEAIFLSEVVVEVQASVPEERPLMAFTHNAGVTAEIEFNNDGWGEPAALRLQARIKGNDAAAPVELPYRRIAGEDGQGSVYRFDVTPLLAPLGVPVDAIKRALKSDAADDGASDGGDVDGATSAWARVQPACVRALVPFGAMEYATLDSSGSPVTVSDADQYSDAQLAAFPYNCTMMVAGELQVEWQDAEGSAQSQSVRFETQVYVTPAEGLGAPAFEPTGSYNLALQSEGENYVVTKSISQPVAAGKYDRFVLWLGAPQSSTHRFVVRLKYNNSDELVSPPVQFDYLMPRGNRVELDRAAEAGPADVESLEAEPL